MSLIQYGGRRTASLLMRRPASWLSARYASRISIPTPPAFPVIDVCPAPTCQCGEMPAGLDIDREHNLNGTMAAYAEQVLISTGRSDWKSKIDEEDESVFLRQLRKFMGKGGKYSDVRAQSPFSTTIREAVLMLYSHTTTSCSPIPPSRHLHRRLSRCRKTQQRQAQYQ